MQKELRGIQGTLYRRFDDASQSYLYQILADSTPFAIEPELAKRYRLECLPYGDTMPSSLVQWGPRCVFGAYDNLTEIYSHYSHEYCKGFVFMLSVDGLNSIDIDRVEGVLVGAFHSRMWVDHASEDGALARFGWVDNRDKTEYDRAMRQAIAVLRKAGYNAHRDDYDPSNLCRSGYIYPIGYTPKTRQTEVTDGIYRLGCTKDVWQQFHDALDRGEKVEIDEAMWEYQLDVLPPKLMGTNYFVLREGLGTPYLYWKAWGEERWFAQQAPSGWGEIGMVNWVNQVLDRPVATAGDRWS